MADEMQQGDSVLIEAQNHPKVFNATTLLRWVRRSDGGTRLQQGFAELTTGELEWRDIPVIQET